MVDVAQNSRAHGLRLNMIALANLLDDASEHVALDVEGLTQVILEQIVLILTNQKIKAIMILLGSLPEINGWFRVGFEVFEKIIYVMINQPLADPMTVALNMTQILITDVIFDRIIEVAGLIATKARVRFV